MEILEDRLLLATNYYWIGSGDWHTVTNWSLSDGGRPLAGTDTIDWNKSVFQFTAQSKSASTEDVPGGQIAGLFVISYTKSITLKTALTQGQRISNSLKSEDFRQEVRVHHASYHLAP